MNLIHPQAFVKTHVIQVTEHNKKRDIFLQKKDKTIRILKELEDAMWEKKSSENNIRS